MLCSARRVGPNAPLSEVRHVESCLYRRCVAKFHDRPRRMQLRNTLEPEQPRLHSRRRHEGYLTAHAVSWRYIVSGSTSTNSVAKIGNRTASQQTV